jgi:undecaprenyl-diphosphatase
MSIWDAAILGLVQGLTEFLPISSTAHLLLVRSLMGHPHIDDAFTVVIQLGTLVAVVAYFWKDILRLARGGRLAWLIVLGTIPAVVVGFLFKKQLKEHFFNLPSMAIASIVFALLLAMAEWWSHRRARRHLLRGESAIGPLDALWVGLWQACALMPGGSRSGTTITGGLFAGLARPAAARFSFLLSIPVILGAGAKDLYDEYKKWKHPESSETPSLFASQDDVAALVVGTLVSAIVGYLAIAWLLRFLQRYSTAVFIVYRLLFGALILVWLASR